MSKVQMTDEETNQIKDTVAEIKNCAKEGVKELRENNDDAEKVNENKEKEVEKEKEIDKAKGNDKNQNADNENNSKTKRVTTPIFQRVGENEVKLAGRYDSSNKWHEVEGAHMKKVKQAKVNHE